MNRAEYRRMYEAEDCHWWYVGLHELILDHVRQERQRVGRPLRILDAGCGTGRLCQLMSPYGEVEGLDASQEAVQFCHQRGVDATVANLNEVRLEPERYDLITSIDVLYHAGIRDDVAVLKQFARALQPGGLLILNLVAFEFLRSSHDVAVHTRERYTRPLLVQRLASAGFRNSYLSYRVTLLFPLIAAYRLAARLVLSRQAPRDTVSDVAVPSPLVNKLLLASIRMENRLLGHCPLPFGSSLLAVARKQ